MNVRIQAGEMARMTKVLAGCLDGVSELSSSVELRHEDQLFSIRAVSGGQFVKMCAPMMGGDGEHFLVDGKMLNNVCQKARGEITLTTDGKTCIVKAGGRTRLPMVSGRLAEPEPVTGKTVKVDTEAFRKAVDLVRYAVADPGNPRVILTGILMETDGTEMHLTALDGFQLARESIPCTGDSFTAVVPGAAMKKVTDCASGDATLEITCGGGRMHFRSDGAELHCSLLTGNYVELDRIIPKEFGTEVMFRAEEMKNALSSGAVANVKNHLVKMTFCQHTVKIQSRSELADFEGEIESMQTGNDLVISFNDRYVMNALGAIGNEYVIMRANTPVAPAVFQGKDSGGIHLTLPVRTV